MSETKWRLRTSGAIWSRLSGASFPFIQFCVAYMIMIHLVGNMRVI